MRQTCLTSLLLLLIASTAAGAADTAPAPTLKLGTVAKIQLPPAPPLTTAQQQHIKDLIDSFTQLDQPGIGFSPTVSGTSFDPLGRSTIDAMVTTGQPPEPSKAMTQLVTIGPDALPCLLSALDDKRPTRIVITHTGSLGMMWFDRERDRNPLNPAETSTHPALAAQPVHKPPVTSYTVKVGDLCFVAIGQIVGRAYQAVHYQPTANIVINSPTTDPQLCADVRAAWTSDTPRQKLLDSLLLDYATQGIFNGASLDRWREGSDRQCTAARLLLYYFPKETAPLIAPRLVALDVRKDSPDINETMRRWVAQGVRPDAFINAVAWCPEPSIHDALVALFKRTDNVDCMVAALPAIHDPALLRERLNTIIDAISPDDRDPYGDAYRLLTRLIPASPAIARELTERYLKQDTIARRLCICRTLQQTPAPWAPQILWPLLSDTRPTGEAFPLAPDQPSSRVSLRICDAAAQALTTSRPDLHFTLEGTHEDLDRQIDAMKTALAGSPTTRPN